MALFVKRTSVGTHMPMYTLGANQNLLVVGLGNIGSEYDGTRHNIGFEALDYFVAQQGFPDWSHKKDLKSHISMQTIAGTRIILAKPTTYMNNSGEAVSALQRFYKITPEQTLIVHDEIDLALGTIRTQYGGSAAGHNGIKSVMTHNSEASGRIRIGIGPKTPPQIDSADFVLARFTNEEQKKLQAIHKEVSSILSDATASTKLYVETRNVL